MCLWHLLLRRDNLLESFFKMTKNMFLFYRLSIFVLADDNLKQYYNDQKRNFKTMQDML